MKKKLNGEDIDIGMASMNKLEGSIVITQRNWKLISNYIDKKIHNTGMTTNKKLTSSMKNLYGNYKTMSEKSCPKCRMVLFLNDAVLKSKKDKDSYFYTKNWKHDPLKCMISAVFLNDCRYKEIKDNCNSDLLPESLNGDKISYTFWARSHLVDYIIRKLLEEAKA